MQRVIGAHHLLYDNFAETKNTEIGSDFVQYGLSFRGCSNAALVIAIYH